MMEMRSFPIELLLEIYVYICMRVALEVQGWMACLANHPVPVYFKTMHTTYQTCITWMLVVEEEETLGGNHHVSTRRQPAAVTAT